MDEPMDKVITDAIRNDWGLELAERSTEDEIIAVLSKEINRLIHWDFARLVSLLYRIDINESKLKALLQENKEADAGRIIGWMILERQKQKKQSREMFTKDENGIPDDQKW
jgi:hypothetical protein